MGNKEAYMFRCLQLAKNGEGFTKPNPMVGAVIVYDDKIIGEGFHRQYGEAHAEVNAIRSVKDRSLLPKSTMYVSLEPCAHYGKTPPCALQIVESGIREVVIATKDPNPKVSGKGIEILQKSGVLVSVGLLEDEARELNSIFFTHQICQRPFVLLKWAQSADGFMDNYREVGDNKLPARLSNAITQSVVHKYRTRVQAIMVATNTALLDNPQLTARKWFGNNPIRVVIDRKNIIPSENVIFDNSAPTMIFTETVPKEKERKNHAEFVQIDFSKDTNRQILNHLYSRGIYSVLVEGGAKLLSSFIEKNLWDEALVEVANKNLSSGIKAPALQADEMSAKKYVDSVQFHLKSKITRKFL